jgi:hypothetical protein
MWVYFSVYKKKNNISSPGIPNKMSSQKFYAIIVTSGEYPCGNVYGVFDSMELATQATKRININNDNIRDEEIFTDVHVKEILSNTLYKGSLTGCSSCMDSKDLLTERSECVDNDQ